MWATYLTAVSIGVASELFAWRQRLWVYRRPLYPLLNVAVMFGLVMGSVAMLVPALGVAVVFALGFAIGLAYEIANLAWLDWWFFPGDRLYGLRGREACATGVSVAWGVVPVAVAVVRGLR